MKANHTFPLFEDLLIVGTTDRLDESVREWIHKLGIQLSVLDPVCYFFDLSDLFFFFFFNLEKAHQDQNTDQTERLLA